MAMVTFRLDDDSNARLTQAARKSGRSKSQILKVLIEQNLDAIEELPGLDETIARFRKEKSEGTLETMTLDELKQALPELRRQNRKALRSKSE